MLLWELHAARMGRARMGAVVHLGDPIPPPPIKRVATMIRECWAGVMNAASRNVTNARSEGMNAKIQWIKRMACGYRSRPRFHNAIYFHLGDLDLYPISLKSAHTEV